jgi:acyl carrier protein
VSDTLQRLQEVFRDVFEDEQLVLTLETTAEDVQGWDSFMHVTLMVNVEKACGVKFSSRQIAGLSNVGQLVEAIEAAPPK